MTNQQIKIVLLLSLLSYVMGRIHQSMANAKLLKEVQDEFDQSVSAIAALEAELHKRDEGDLRKDAIRTQEDRNLSD